MPESTSDTVASLLEASRAAHLRARDARSQKLFVAAKASLELARDLRVQAHTRDPGHQDVAWAAEVKPTHGEYMAFYTQQLGAR
jgi:hypothetical protein